MQKPIARLRKALKTVAESKYQKERALALAEANVLIDEIAASLKLVGKPSDQTLFFPVVKLLDALKKGKIFLGRQYHVSKHKEFEEAVVELFRLMPEIEEIKIGK